MWRLIPSKMDLRGPKLCPRCSDVFRYEEGVLFDEEIPALLSPATCPLCAIIEFDSLIHQTQFAKVEHELSTNALGEQRCVLHFYSPDKFSHQRSLLILANGKTA